MRKGSSDLSLLTISFLFCMCVCAAIPARASYISTANTITLHGAGAPAGACFSGEQYTNDTTGDFYYCWLGAWTIFSLGPATVSGSGVTGQAASWRAAAVLTAEPIYYADLFAGADMGAEINAACAALPATGGIVSAVGFTGAQTIGTTINCGSSGTKPVEIDFGASTITVTSAVGIELQRYNKIIGVGSGLNGSGGTRFLAGVNSTILMRANGTSGADKASIVLRDFQLDGNKGSFSGTQGLSLLWAPYFDIENVNIFNCSGVQSTIVASFDAVWSSGKISSGTTHGLVLTDDTANVGNANDSFNLEVDSNGGDGVRYSGNGAGILFQLNAVLNTGAGLRAFTSSNSNSAGAFKIMSSTFESNTDPQGQLVINGVGGNSVIQAICDSCTFNGASGSATAVYLDYVTGFSMETPLFFGSTNSIGYTSHTINLSINNPRSSDTNFWAGSSGSVPSTFEIRGPGGSRTFNTITDTSPSSDLLYYAVGVGAGTGTRLFSGNNGSADVFFITGTGSGFTAGPFGIGTQSPSSLFSVGSSSQFQVNSTGIISVYKGIVNAGNGGVMTKGVFDVSNGTTTTSGNLLVAPAIGIYHVLAYSNTITAGSGVCGEVLTLGWTDETGAKTQSAGSLDVGSTGAAARVSGDTIIYVASGNVTYTATVSGAGCTNQVWALHLSAWT